MIPKDYAEGGDGINGNHGTAQQVTIRDSAPKWVLILTIVFSTLALALAVLGLWMAASALQDARDAATAAAAAAVRSEIAERRANISELYAKQVFVELNRLGYPVKTPAEEHSVAPVEASK